MERCTISRHNPSPIDTSNTPAHVRAPQDETIPKCKLGRCKGGVGQRRGLQPRGEDGWCEPRGLPMELRETIKKHSETTTSDARRPLRRKFLLRRPVFGRAYRANVLQVNIFINLQFGRPADVFRFVCCAPCMPAGASLNRHDPRTHTPPPHAHLARLVCPIERQKRHPIMIQSYCTHPPLGLLTNLLTCETLPSPA